MNYFVKVVETSWRNKVEISDNIFYVGARDWNRRLFDALIPTPRGTTYNSYLVVGKQKTALIDTVNPGFEKELEQRVRKVTDPSQLDYIVMNHAEPDHAGSIPHLMKINAKATLITSSRGAKMAQVFYKTPENRIKSVNDGETVDLGGKTLRFIEAPLLHWPETMFTYVPENRILFPCDFFGAHVAEGLFNDEVPDLLQFAQRYFGEIMMPFRYNGQRGMEKIKDLPLDIIAPSHGPIIRDTGATLDAYRKWVNGETEQKAVIVYVSMWGSTEKMIQIMHEALVAEGITTTQHNLVNADISEVAKDLVDSKAIVLGTPTVLGGAHPLAIYAAHLVKALRPPAKYVAALSSYGWGGGAIKQIQEILGSMKIETIGALDVYGPPTDEETPKITELAKTLAQKIKQG